MKMENEISLYEELSAGLQQAIDSIRDENAKQEQKTVIELGRPDCGWSSLHLKDKNGNEFCGHLSYIDNVPEMLLHTFELFLENRWQIAVSFDEEGTEWTLIIDEYLIKILCERDTVSTHVLFISARELIAKILEDIHRDIDAWSEWDAYGDTAEEYKQEAQENKATLLSMLESVKQKLQSL